MELRSAQIPRTAFWPYDIFGYLLPGAVLSIAVGVANGAVDVVGATGGTPERARVTPSLAEAALGLLIAYLAGHMVAALSSRLLEYEALRRFWGLPTALMFPQGGAGASVVRRWRRVARWFGARLLGILQPSYRRPYSPAFRDAFDSLFRETFHTKETNIDQHDRFWMCWEYITLHHPVGYRRATHFLELYGFSRNVSMAFLLCALLLLFGGWQAPITPGWWVTASVVLGAVFFANYLKLIRRMNDEVYRAFVIAARPGTALPTPSDA
jgi:hypothetical protein